MGLGGGRGGGVFELKAGFGGGRGGGMELNCC